MNRKYIIAIILLSLSLLIFGQDAPINGISSTTAITIENQFPDYPATPGDIYDINFMTSGSDKSTLLRGFVDSNYNIDLSFLGEVNVKGLIYTQVQDELKKKISTSYPGSIINVTIRVPGKFKVTILGEVTDAVILDAMSLTTLAEIVSGKTTDYASFRDIEVRSENGETKVYDLFKFQRFADLKNNPFLKPNDVITIRPYSKVVNITGQVKRPGLYQLIQGDTLDSVINLYADGFTKIAEKSKIVIQRTLEQSDNYNDKTLYINADKNDLKLVKLSDYDKITVENKTIYNPIVIIQGAISNKAITREDGTSGVEVASGNSVSNKIIVPITTGSRVSTVMEIMEGSFNLTSDIENAFILRGSEKIKINLKDIFRNISSDQDIIVEDGDMIIIPFRQLRVYVAGSVNNNTAVPFIENRTARYYIGLAGGINRTENAFGTYSIHNVYGEKLAKDSIISPEDVIWVNRDHPMSYVSEYGGWLTLISSVIITSINLSDILAN